MIFSGVLTVTTTVTVCVRNANYNYSQIKRKGRKGTEGHVMWGLAAALLIDMRYNSINSDIFPEKSIHSAVSGQFDCQSWLQQSEKGN